MPVKATLHRVHNDRREGKAPSTQAGEFVREEIEHVREGKHGARSSRQAIAIGPSKARRAGRHPCRLDPAVSRDAARPDPGGARGRLARRPVQSGPQGRGAVLEALAEPCGEPRGSDTKG